MPILVTPTGLAIAARCLFLMFVTAKHWGANICAHFVHTDFLLCISYKSKLLTTCITKRSRPKRVGFLHSIGRHRVIGRLRQSSASLHPPFGTSFLREPLTRPRPATLWQSLPTTTQRASMLVFQEQVPYFGLVSSLTRLYRQHTS